MAGTIESRIALRGDISDVLKKMSTYQRKVYSVNNKVNKSFSNTNKVIGQVGGLLAGLGVGIGFKKILDVSGDFQNSMARVKAITQATDEDFKKLSNTAKQLGATTQFSASQAAEGLQFLGMAGYNTEQSISALPSTLNLAAAGAIELGQAADIASNVVAGMDYDISETERVIDVLAHTSRTANTNVTEMGEAAKKAAPVFGGLNLEVEELALSAAILANNGIKGADAGTAMAGALSRLLKQPKMVAEALGELGVIIDETSIKNDGFIGTLERLRDAGINNTQMAAIFGDHWKSIGTIINTSESELSRLTKAIGNSQGAAESMAKDGVGVWQKGMNMLNSAIEGLMIRLGEGGLLGFVTQLVTNITAFVGVLSNMTGSFENAIPVIYGAATAITALYAAMTGGLSAIITAVSVAAVGIVAYWNDIMRAIENGINAVIDFANKSTILRTAFVIAIEYVKYFWEFIKTYVGFIIDLFGELGGFIVDVFKGAWKEVESWFNGEDYSFIDTIGQEFSRMLKGVKNDAVEAALHLREHLEGAVQKVADAYNGKEIAHVKLNLTTTTGGGKKQESGGKVGQAKPAIESFGEDFEFEELNEGLDIVDSKIINLNDELLSLGNSFQTVFGGASDSLGSFIGKALSATPKLIENLQKLGLVQKQQATQEVVQNQAKAMSSGVASGAKLPFPANIAAIAAILATVGSVFASLPKFEDGGVVGGSSYYGDKILARVNSKELILNRQQQASMYHQMNGSFPDGSFKIGEARVRGGDILYSIEYTTLNRKRNG